MGLIFFLKLNTKWPRAKLTNEDPSLVRQTNWRSEHLDNAYLGYPMMMMMIMVVVVVALLLLGAGGDLSFSHNAP